jgi:hypothetical protein
MCAIDANSSYRECLTARKFESSPRVFAAIIFATKLSSLCPFEFCNGLMKFENYLFTFNSAIY